MQSARAGPPQGASDQFPAPPNSTKKHRLLRCGALEYIMYSCGSAPCIRRFLANFSALFIGQMHPRSRGVCPCHDSFASWVNT